MKDPDIVIERATINDVADIAQLFVAYGMFYEQRADITLVIGATLSTSTFGSHACFYSDATVLTAQASGCTPMQHALTQIPYA